MASKANSLNSTKYIQLENVFQYSVRPNLNLEFKTCCIVLDKTKLNKPAYILQVFKKYVNKEIEHTTTVLKYLNEVSKKMYEGDVEESIVTLQLTEDNVSHMINIILLAYDLSVIKEKSLFRFNEDLRGIGGHICHSLRKNELRNFNLVIPETTDTKNTNNITLKVLEGFLMAMYSFKKYKSDGKELPLFRDQLLNTLNTNTKTAKVKTKYGLRGGSSEKTKKRVGPIIKSKNPNNYAVAIISNNKTLKKQIDQLVTIIKNVFTCRDLINEPGNMLTTASMGPYLKKLISDYKLPIDIEIYDREACKKLGMGLLVAVGEGNVPERQSGLIILKYNGIKGSGGDIEKQICMIGKGITQDTGGYSLKGVSDMPAMKSDKSGAAIVLTTVLCAAKLGLPVNLIGMLPMAQNSIGPGSIVPGDIVKAYNGMMVEITDSDAEGRLIIADCIAYAVDKFPKYQLLDVATLTGEQEVLSCKKFSTLIHVNSGVIADKLVIAGEEEGERIVKFPYMSDFMDTIKSDVADVKNTSSDCDGDIFTSSLFMSSFLKSDSRWIHIDLGGNTFDIENDYLEPGALASGVGVKLLINLLQGI